MTKVDKKLQRELTLGWKILTEKNLRPVEKLILAEVARQSGRKGYCWAGNDFFAARLGIGERTASRAVADMVKNNFIEMKLEGYHRKLWLGTAAAHLAQ